MSGNDRTEPLAPPGAAPRPWPAYDATTAGPRGAPPAHAPQQPPHPPHRPWRAALWGALGFVVGVILTALLALALLAPAAAPSASGPASGAPLTVMVTDALISESLDAATGSSGLILTQSHAHIQANGQIVISGVLQGTTIAAGASYTLVVQPYVSQHTLAVKTLRFSVAGFPLPTVALSPIQTQVNQQLAQSSHVSVGVGQALVVSGVTFSDGAMMVHYAAASGG